MIPPESFSNTFSISYIPGARESLGPTLKCGSLICYHGTDYAVDPTCPLWRGSVLAVMGPGASPSLSLWAEHMHMVDQQTGSAPRESNWIKVAGGARSVLLEI